ncbi:MAG: amidohydrolase family protein [Promethearchaeota archaeon]
MVIEYNGTEYKVFDAHTHWSRLMSKILRPVLEFLSTNELLDYVYASWNDLKKVAKDRHELKVKMYAHVLDKYGIDMGVILPVFQMDVKFSKSCEELLPERAIGFGALLPRAKDKKLEKSFEYLKKNKFKGIKLHAQFNDFNVKVHAKELSRVFEFLEENKMVALFHSGSHFEIDDLNNLLKDFEELKVILGHMGLNPQVDQAIRCAREHANVYLETSGGYYRYMLEHAIKDPDIGVEKVLYGSDLPTLDPTVEMMKILQLDMISEEEKKMILWDNAYNLIMRK